MKGEKKGKKEERERDEGMKEERQGRKERRNKQRKKKEAEAIRRRIVNY